MDPTLTTTLVGLAFVSGILLGTLIGWAIKEKEWAKREELLRQSSAHSCWVRYQIMAQQDLPED